jgi:hypothetical protein
MELTLAKTMEKKSIMNQREISKSQNESENLDQRDSQSNISGIGGASKAGKS